MQRGTPPPPRARSQYACPPLSCNLNLSKIPEPSATIRRKPDSTDTPNLQQPTRRYLATPPADSISIAFMFPDSCSECICSFLYLALSLTFLNFLWSLLGSFLTPFLTLSLFFLISSCTFLNKSSTDLLPEAFKVLSH